MLYGLGQLNVLAGWRSEMKIGLYILGAFLASLLLGLLTARYIKAGRGKDDDSAY